LERSKFADKTNSGISETGSPNCCNSSWDCWIFLRRS